ncbi:MAG: hypothetical protein BWX51_00125 [Bacteroidetes bacterium ADurb.Bin012]|jgi:hypothetical protein|nr:MAG: hypothetical protein BWX51_00125 [Bacteroidetes bacterium ADurb.Bin012]
MKLFYGNFLWYFFETNYYANIEDKIDLQSEKATIHNEIQDGKDFDNCLKIN